MNRIIWWIRRDLRVEDNLTLHRALRDGAAVIPVFILDPVLMEGKALAPSRKQFLFQSLVELDETLRARGSRLIVRRGNPARELARLTREAQADAVYMHRDYTPYARRRDGAAARALEASGVRLESFNDLYLADPEQVVKDDGTPYTVYTPFRRRFEQVVSIPGVYETRGAFNTPTDIPSLDLPSLAPAVNPDWQVGGARAGMQLASNFIRGTDGITRYSEKRDMPAEDATSHLSPHLHFGTVSVRELVRRARALAAGDGARVWIDELVWREFYNHVLWHFPYAARQSFRPEYSEIEWQGDQADFEAWREGRTGYPLVDAGMRQLLATGWMHNRARMVTASFLTKDLLIDWRKGERFFLQNLIDGDIASNNGGWQWAAGTGTDAQPYFRVFNPVLQSRRFDPDGAYIRRWVPEFERVPAKYIHAPWEMPAEAARACGFRLGVDYPAPLVDHAVQRARALEMYRAHARLKRNRDNQQDENRNVEMYAQ